MIQIARRARVWPGSPYPLGATFDGRGVNFALFSANAEKVELCLFDAADAPIANFVGQLGCRRERAIVHEPVLLAS